MSRITPSFAAGFVDTCVQKGLSVKAAAAMLWRFGMTQASPAYMEGVKEACEKTPIPVSIPEMPVKQASVDRIFVKTARENLAYLDAEADQAADPFLKQAFIRRRNDLQLALNAHILGEA